ncbi:MAG: type II secretion system minor pseudopilin GspI [Gammaproteobacteria bacterium]
MQERARGFTLIEVMVAMFILALTFIGVIGTASYVSRTIDVIQEKTLALWVGQNAVSEIHLGVWGQIQDGMSLQNDTMIAGRAFQWKGSVTREEQYHRVKVEVRQGRANSPMAEVVFYEPR